jgi:hypothetical protein
MAKVIMTRYVGMSNSLVYPECPYAGYQYPGSKEIDCKNGHEYCSTLNENGKCPYE